MAQQQAGLVQEGRERFNSAFERIDEELQRVQKQLQKRRKTFEKQLEGQRRDIEKRTRKQVRRFQTEWRKHPVGRRIEKLRGRATAQIESGVDGVLGLFQIASKSDLDRVDRKIGQLTRKLKEMERTRRGNGQASR